MDIIGSVNTQFENALLADPLVGGLAGLVGESGLMGHPAPIEDAGPTFALDPSPAEVSHALAHITDATELVNKTLFLRVHFGKFGDTRKVAGGDVLTTDADMSLMAVTKKLLLSPELDAIKKADTAMRKWLDNVCLPFDMGIRLVPYGLVEMVDSKFEEFSKTREGLVDTFIAEYPTRMAEIAGKLGTQYKLSEYPSAAEVRARFTLTWEFRSFSVPGQLKTISASIFKKETEKVAESLKNAQEEITAVMRETLLKLVSNLQSRLSPGDDGKAKILKEAPLKKLNEFLDTFDLRNVTGDSDLKKLVDQAKALVNGKSAKDFKSNEEFKASVLGGLDSIVSTLGDLVEDKPDRMFKLDDED